MNHCIKLLLLFLLPLFSNAQLRVPDSLINIAANANSDSARYAASTNIYNYYEESNRDSALYYAEQGLVLARKNNKLLNEANSCCRKGYQQINLGLFSDAFQTLLRAFTITEDPKNEKY